MNFQDTSERVLLGEAEKSETDSFARNCYKSTLRFSLY